MTTVIIAIMLTLITKYLWINFLGITIKEYYEIMCEDVLGIIFQVTNTIITFLLYLILLTILIGSTH